METRFVHLLRMFLLALLVTAFAAVLTACGSKKKIDASSMIKAEFKGLNGEGTVVLSFDKEGLIEALSQEKALTERQLETLSSLGSDLQKDFSISKREGLSNGDSVEVTGGLDKNLLKDLGYAVNNDTLKLTVEGLVEPMELNIADYIHLDISGFEGYGTAYAYFDWEAFAKAVAARWAELNPDMDPYGYESLRSYYECAQGVEIELDKNDGYSNNDTVNGTITLSGTEIPECGITLTAGAYTGTVTGLAEPETVDLASALTIHFDGIVPNVIVRYDVDYSQPFVPYTSLRELGSSQTEKLHNGDTYSLEITYDEEELKANGFLAGNTTASAVVEGLPSYDFELSGPDDPLLANLDAEARLQVEESIQNSVESLQDNLLGDSKGWVQWGNLTTSLETEALAVLDEETSMDNVLFLIYHTTAPLRLIDGTTAAGDAYYVYTCSGVTVSADGVLSTDSNGYVKRYATLEEADNFISEECGYQLGENAQLTRNSVDPAGEQEAVPAEEPRKESAEADTTAAATDSCLLGELVPDYAYDIETWETMTDPYGNDYENVLAFRAGNRARADYQLNGSWNRFTGTLCTYNDAGTEAVMSLYIWGDDRILYAVDGYQRSRKPESFAIDVTGVQNLSIQTVCYGNSSGAWLFISDGLFEATQEEDKPTQRFASFSDVRIVDSRDMDIDAWGSMYTDICGNVMRDCYEFDSQDESMLRVKLGGRYTNFRADVFVTAIPWSSAASAKLEVLTDGAQAAMIENITMFSPVQTIDIDVTGVDVLELHALKSDEDSERIEFAIGSTMLSGEISAAENDVLEDFAQTEYAPVNLDILKMVEGTDSEEETQSIECGDYRYMIVNRASDYATAEFTATRLGGTLATPKTNRQCAALTDLAKNGASDRYWIGAKRQSQGSETWIWTDGEVITDMSRWNSGEPNNSGGNEDCVMLYDNGKWNDYPGDNELPFIIQFPALSGGEAGGAVSLADLPRTAEDDISLVSVIYDGVSDPLALQFNADYDGWAAFDLDGAYAAFDASLYVQPDSSCNARAAFAVFGDGKLIYQADNLKCSSPALKVHADVTGVKTLKVMTTEYVSANNCRIDLINARLTGAEEKVLTQAADAMTLETVDAKELETRLDLAFDAAGDPQPGWLELDAADEGYVMYNCENAYTSVRGYVCGGSETADGETAKLNIYTDDKLAATIDSISRDSKAQYFEVDLDGAGTVRLESSRTGESWENIIYLAGVTLE